MNNISASVIGLDDMDKTFLLKGVILAERIGMNNTPIALIKFGEAFIESFGWHMFCLEKDFIKLKVLENKILEWEGTDYPCEIFSKIIDRNSVLLKFKNKIFYGHNYTIFNLNNSIGKLKEINGR